MADTNTVFDVHHHFGTNPLAGPVEDTSLEEKAARHIDVMELSDISGVALLAPPIYLNPEGLADTRAINDDLYKILSSTSSRRIPICPEQRLPRRSGAQQVMQTKSVVSDD